MEAKVLTAHVPLPLAKKVDDLAVQLDRSRGWILKQALAAWVDREEARTRMTIEGLSDVDAGRSVYHEAVEVWADHLGDDKPAAFPGQSGGGAAGQSGDFVCDKGVKC